MYLGDFMYMLLDFAGWCAPGSGLISVIKIIKTVLNVIRFAVPIGLIVMTIIDVSKNVINPDDKDSLKKIGTRAIAAVVVFLIPTIVNLVMNIIDIGFSNSQGYNVSDCWRNA